MRVPKMSLKIKLFGHHSQLLQKKKVNLWTYLNNAKLCPLASKTWLKPKWILNAGETNQLIEISQILPFIWMAREQTLALLCQAKQKLCIEVPRWAQVRCTQTSIDKEVLNCKTLWPSCSLPLATSSWSFPFVDRAADKIYVADTSLAFFLNHSIPLDL